MTTDAARDTILDLAGAPVIDGLCFRRPRGNDADWAAMAAVVSAANRHDGVPWMPSAAKQLPGHSFERANQARALSMISGGCSSAAPGRSSMKQSKAAYSTMSKRSARPPPGSGVSRRVRVQSSTGMKL